MATSLLPLARWSQVTTAGTLATAVSEAVLAWRGRRETGSAAAPINAVSHSLWPQQALQNDDFSAKHTLTGTVVHAAASMMWAWLYAEVRARRRAPTLANAVTDAVAVTALASFVDLKLVPDRLSPGFEKRLMPSSTAMVYGGFAAGLAISGLLAVLNRR